MRETSFRPYEQLVGGYSVSDGTIDFYSRIGTLLTEDAIVVDLGAGRAAWFEEDENNYRRKTRLLKGKAKRVIAIDVDPAVAKNRACDEYYIMRNNQIPLDDDSVHIVVSDFVLEHVEDFTQFYSEVDRILTNGGWFCARTPHKYSYVSILSRVLGNKSHVGILRHAQKDRKSEDVFPTYYKANKISTITRTFVGYKNKSFVNRADPAYFFGNRIIYLLQSFLHHTMWKEFSGHIYVFMQKPGTSRSTPGAVK